VIGESESQRHLNENYFALTPADQCSSNYPSEKK